MMRLSVSLRICLLLPGLLLAGVGRAQILPGLPLERVSLTDLSAFSDPPSNWRIVGDAAANPTVQGDLRTEAGTGLLANQPSQQSDGHLFTRWEHGDIDVELDVMMAAGSNSGIYLQGRYEVQLFDSWGKQNQTFADMGGIYQHFDESRPEGHEAFGGSPPLSNVARAPGLWQHLRIEFRAPRFDESGRKIANARFVRVELNGVVVQQDVEVTAPTRAAAFTDEQPRGPLMIQGNLGALAIRNLAYRTFERPAPMLEDLAYEVYEGTFRSLADLEGKEIAYSGRTNRIEWDVLRTRDDFALVYEGQFPAPSDGTYQFGMICEGGCSLSVGDDYVLGSESAGGGWFAEASPVELEAGLHSFRLVYYKSFRWWRPTLQVFVEGPDFERAPLHEVVPGRYREPNPIHVSAEGQPRLLRGFMEFGGEKLTHAISVGSPSGSHFSYDLASAALLQVWRGEFLDVTQMWHERGEPQLAVPIGSLITFPGTAMLAAGDAGGPASDSIALNYGGYELDDRGYPEFRYTSESLELRDHVDIANDGRELRRTLTVDGATDGMWLRLVRSHEITPLGQSSYAIGDRTYYLVVGDAAADAVISRHRDGTQELMLPLSSGRVTVSYAVRW